MKAANVGLDIVIAIITNQFYKLPPPSRQFVSQLLFKESSWVLLFDRGFGHPQCTSSTITVNTSLGSRA